MARPRKWEFHTCDGRDTLVPPQAAHRSGGSHCIDAPPAVAMDTAGEQNRRAASASVTADSSISAGSVKVVLCSRDRRARHSLFSSRSVKYLSRGPLLDVGRSRRRGSRHAGDLSEGQRMITFATDSFTCVVHIRADASVFDAPPVVFLPTTGEENRTFGARPRLRAVSLSLPPSSSRLSP